MLLIAGPDKGRTGLMIGKDPDLGASFGGTIVEGGSTVGKWKNLHRLGRAAPSGGAWTIWQAS